MFHDFMTSVQEVAGINIEIALIPRQGHFIGCFSVNIATHATRGCNRVLAVVVRA
jgi:hypothetical protein